MQPVGVKGSGQHEIDGDVGTGDRSCDTGEKCRQPRARPGGQIKPDEGRLDRSRRDVDDAAELFGDHGIDRFFDDLDRHHHIGDDAVEHLLAREFAEITKRRTGIVVDQDVGLGAGCEQGVLPFGGGHIRSDRRDLRAGGVADFSGRCLHLVTIAAVDYHLATRFRELPGTGTAEPAARRANNGLAASNAEIHAFSRGCGGGGMPAPIVLR